MSTFLTQDGPPPDFETGELELTPYSKLVSREEEGKRETTKLPLEPVNFELYGRSEEVGIKWPSVRFDERDTRLALYAQLYRGDIGNLILDKAYTRNFKNYFRRVCEVISVLLTSAEITVTPDLVEESVLQNVVADLIVDQWKYGGSLLRTTTDRESEEAEGNLYMDVIDPSCWYPRMDGGHILAVPYTSDEAESYRHDVIKFTIIEPDGTVEEQLWTYGGERRTANKLIKSERIPNLQFITKILRSPHTSNNFWGTSQFDDLAPIVMNLTVRQSSYARILNAHENPMLNAYISQSKLKDFAGTGPNPDNATGDQQELEDGTKAFQEWRRQNFAIFSDEMAELKYLTWDGNLEPSAWFIQHMEDSISMLTGIPQPLLSGQEIPSGIAMKRMYTVLYAATLATLNDTKFGLEQGLSKVVEGEVTVEWPHFFDELQDSLDQSEKKASPFGDFMGEEDEDE